MFGEIGFQPFGKFTAGEYNVASATFAIKPDIRAETGDCPFVGTARMLFAEAQVIVELEVREHGWKG
jgi:hypothetical protein